MKEELFDVIVYESESHKITNIVGTAMQRNTGHYNAEKRLTTMYYQMNESFDATIVPTGKYKVGDILNDPNVNVCGRDDDWVPPAPSKPTTKTPRKVDKDIYS